MFELGCSLRALGSEHVDLALRGHEARPGMLQLRVAGAQRGVSLLRALNRAGARLHQVVVAGALLLRKFQIRVRSSDIGCALLYYRLLEFELGVEVPH